MLDFVHLPFAMATGIPGVSVVRSGNGCRPRVGLLGMLHGNETAGQALWQLMADIGYPQRGEIYLIVGHPDALLWPGGGVRYIEHDLNRLFHDDQELKARSLNTYGPDHRRCLDLREFLQNLDFLVDIHSTSSPSKPFMIACGPDDLIAPIADVLPIRQIHGLERFIDGTAGQWVARHGGGAMTLEVGQHADPDSMRTAYDLTRRLLFELNMVEECETAWIWRTTARCRHVMTIDHLQGVRSDFSYERSFVNFDRLHPNEIVGRDGGGFYRAPGVDTAVILMPAAIETLRQCRNTDAFFFGTEMI